MPDPLDLAALERSLAAAQGAMSPSEALGFVTAVVSMPSTLDSDTWTALVLGMTEGAVTPRDATAALTALAATIAGRLEAGVPAGPPTRDEAQVVQWCRGYCIAAHLDPRWTGDAKGLGFLLPVSVIAGGPDAAADDAELRGKLDAARRGWIARLDALTLTVYRHFGEARD